MKKHRQLAAANGVDHFDLVACGQRGRGQLALRHNLFVDFDSDTTPAQAKLLACDVAVTTTQLGQLMHGGWGYAEEYPISRYVVDATVLPIFEGVKPILELKVIGRALLAS